MPSKKTATSISELINGPEPGKTARRGTGLLTSSMLIASPTMLPGQPAGAAAAVRGAIAASQQWSNNAASRGSSPPEDPDFFTLTSNGEPVLNLRRGIYICGAPTGAGKTVLSMALAAWANAEGTPASYISCFEPNSPEVKYLSKSYFDTDKSTQFWDDAKALMAPKGPKVKLVIYDSCTLPIKTFASNNAYKQQSTFAGGMQPSDRGFVDRGYDVCRQSNACIVINLNSTLIPYVESLAGATEGMINVLDVANFTYADRSSASARRMVNVTIPTEFVNGALDHFGFNVYNGAMSGSVSAHYTGVNTQANQ